ncbi:MAG: phage recombination protein Bet [Acholeplasmatales bacterium]|nr:phage recombination protein Bet [Acholeplasmatales bacterium]
MESNNNRMASDAQINYLKKLGYQGSTANLTSDQASNLIKSYSNRNNAQEQPQQNYGGYNPQYGAPTQEQYGNQSVTNPQPSATPQQEPQNNIMVADNSNYSITTRTGEEILISPEVINMYIGSALTQPEFQYFFAICKNYGLNPFLRDIYAIKFGSQPATFVIDYKVMQQAADNNPNYDGLKNGMLFLDKDGNPKEREGAYILPGEKLIGSWCDVYRKDRSHTNRVYALLEENLKYTKDGKVNSNWSTKPVFMIAKVAKAQALRETFPNMFSNNTYISEEMPETQVEFINAEVKLDTTDDVNAEQKSKTGKKKIVKETPASNITPNDTEGWPD